MISFHVIGRPYPQGSKKAFTDKRGHARLTESSGLSFAAWRNAMTEAAVRARGTNAPISGPVGVDVTFRFAMPASRSKADRVHGIAWKGVAPDLDKLQRALADALEASKLIGSDAQIAQWHAQKIEIFDGWEGIQITIRELSLPIVPIGAIP